MRIELLHVPACPHVDDARELLRSCLTELGVDGTVEEREGAYPSPTILIDDVDVMGSPGTTGAMCRLDVPTKERIMNALRRDGTR
jgi:hypothetical protein